MNLDSLNVLWRPTPKPREQVGTMGTNSIHADASVPNVVPTIGNIGNKIPVSHAGAAMCSPLFPVCSQASEEEKPNVYEVVPTVPCVPNENQQACNVEAGG